MFYLTLQQLFQTLLQKFSYKTFSSAMEPSLDSRQQQGLIPLPRNQSSNQRAMKCLQKTFFHSYFCASL